jgi:ATP adenylyltransferase/5',5'''-P-1,P-4-tetraphosphate phosphorylase II
MKDMFGDFDPYDALIAMDQRLGQLTDAHNRMANEFMKVQQEFSTLLVSHHQLQQAHLKLSDLIAAKALFDLEKDMKGQ